MLKDNALDTTGSGQETRPCVAVFRKRVLPFSETFVAYQTCLLRRFEAVVVGLSSVESGRHLLGDIPIVLLDAVASRPRWARAMLSIFGRPNRVWLREIAAYRPALIHAHFGSSGVTAMPIARALDIPLVVTFHGYDALENVDRRYHRARERLFKQADCVLADSDFIVRRLIALGCPEERVIRHYIGTRLPDDEPGVESETPRAGAPTVLFVGRLTPQKGCDHLLDVIPRLLESHPDLDVWIAGDGEARPALETQAQAVNAAAGRQVVTFFGALPPTETRDRMRRAWVLCNPSRVGVNGWQEAFGLVFVEAQSVGTPTVGYDTGGIGEAIGEGGFTVPADNRAALGDRLLALLDNAELRQRLGEIGRTRTREHFDADGQSRKLEALYERVIRERAPID